MGAAVRAPEVAAVQDRVQKLALQTNVSSVVSASGGRPVRYILVQSNHTAETENVVVIGYRPAGAGAWRFFYQRYPRYTNHDAVLASGALEWQLWDDPWTVVDGEPKVIGIGRLAKR